MPFGIPVEYFPHLEIVISVATGAAGRAGLPPTGPGLDSAIRVGLNPMRNVNTGVGSGKQCGKDRHVDGI